MSLTLALKRNVVLLGSAGIRWLLRDTFATDRAAGAVNGTMAEPVGGLRTVVDTYASTELVTNGLFAANITGWTDASDALCSIAWNAGGFMDVIVGAANTARARATVIPTIAGKTYNVTWVAGGGALIWKFGTAAGGTQLGTGAGAVGANAQSFVATTTTSYLEFSHADALATYTLDTVSCLPTTGLLSISGGAAVFAGGKAAPEYGDPGLWYPAQVRKAGRAVLFTAITNGRIIGGWQDVNSGDFANGHSAGFGNVGTQMRLTAGSPVIGALTVGLSYTYLVVLRATGALVLVKGGTEYPNWTLMYSELFSGATTPLYPAIQNRDAIVTATLPRVLDLPAPWTSNYGPATSVVAAPVLNSTATHTPDCLLEFSGVVPTLGATSVLYRSTADDAGWQVDVNTDGNVYLQELNGGTTQRGVAAHTLADGAAYRVVVIAVGNLHKIFVNNVLLITYTDAGNFQNTATAAKVLAVGTGETMANLIAWPRYPSLPGYL